MMFDDFSFADSMFNMMGTHEARLVGNVETDMYTIDTCEVYDCQETPYETAIAHKEFKGGDWIIVEQYEDREEAEKGHAKWIKIMEESEPLQLMDIDVWSGTKTPRKRGE